jgi:hypothetical protein
VARYTIEKFAMSSTKLGIGRATPMASEYVLMRGTVEERTFATEAEAARWAAEAFTEWHQTMAGKRNFPDDRTALLAWILTEGLLRDYDLFAKVANVLADDGLDTRPPPPRDHFESQIKAFHR